MEEQCRNCKFFALPENKEGSPVPVDMPGLCKRYPPQVFPVPMQSRITGQVEMMFRSAWTPVPPDDCCGEFDERVTPEMI